MLLNVFLDVYSKFKLHFYSQVCRNFETREASLSTLEVFCAETIYALNKPTINEFSTFLQISPPNAAYKVNCLVKKGYVKRTQSELDKREFYLEVTDKFLNYYAINYNYIGVVMERIKNRFPQEDLDKMEYMLDVISKELMEEVNIKTKADYREEIQRETRRHLEDN